MNGLSLSVLLVLCLAAVCQGIPRTPRQQSFTVLVGSSPGELDGFDTSPIAYQAFFPSEITLHYGDSIRFVFHSDIPNTVSIAADETEVDTLSYFDVTTGARNKYTTPLNIGRRAFFRGTNNISSGTRVLGDEDFILHVNVRTTRARQITFFSALRPYMRGTITVVPEATLLPQTEVEVARLSAANLVFADEFVSGALSNDFTTYLLPVDSTTGSNNEPQWPVTVGNSFQVTPPGRDTIFINYDRIFPTWLIITIADSIAFTRRTGVLDQTIILISDINQFPSLVTDCAGSAGGQQRQCLRPSFLAASQVSGLDYDGGMQGYLSTGLLSDSVPFIVFFPTVGTYTIREPISGAWAYVQVNDQN